MKSATKNALEEYVNLVGVPSSICYFNLLYTDLVDEQRVYWVKCKLLSITVIQK